MCLFSGQYHEQHWVHIPLSPEVLQPSAPRALAHALLPSVSPPRHGYGSPSSFGHLSSMSGGSCEVSSSSPPCTPSPFLLLSFTAVSAMWHGCQFAGWFAHPSTMQAPGLQGPGIWCLQLCLHCWGPHPASNMSSTNVSNEWINNNNSSNGLVTKRWNGCPCLWLMSLVCYSHSTTSQSGHFDKSRRKLMDVPLYTEIYLHRNWLWIVSEITVSNKVCSLKLQMSISLQIKFWEQAK